MKNLCKGRQCKTAKIKNPTLLTIGLILIAVPILTGSSELFAISGTQYIQFRTTENTAFAHGSAMAYTPNCGNTLTSYGISSYGGSGHSLDKYCMKPSGGAKDIFGCAGDFILLLENLPDELVVDNKKPSLWQCNTDTTLLVICEDRETNLGYYYTNYKSDIPSEISTSAFSITPQYELDCAGSTISTTTTTLETITTSTTTTTAGIGICVIETEVCDGIDNDCDDRIDEGCVSTTTTTIPDFDGGGNGGTNGDGDESFLEKVFFNLGDFEVTGLILMIGGGILIVLAL